MPTSLLKFQIGPVQDFIAQARSTRDLWSGSYILSWLVAAGVRHLVTRGGSLIFPNPENQPLLGNPESWKSLDQGKLLTPNLPNLFVARIPSEEVEILATDIASTIETEWNAIADACWSQLVKHQIVHGALHTRFAAQIKRHLAISWQITPETNAYATDSQRNGWMLDAVRQTRSFTAWDSASSSHGNEKDSLSGKEEALCGGVNFAKEMAKLESEYASLFKHTDQLAAVTLIKRVWHLAYLRDKHELKTASREFKIPSTRGIAMREPDSNDDDDMESANNEKYFAVLALDGDQVGKWIGGEFTDKQQLEAHHMDFSAALGDFALNKARLIVQSHDGRLIYAGGDDVLAIVPAETALDCARLLRAAFLEATSGIKGKDKYRNEKVPDCSVGISIAHFKSPLQDAIREAQRAEKRAKRAQDKGGLGRSAVAVTLMKRSGEIIEWGCQWDSKGLELYQEIARKMQDKELSAKFPHRVSQLIEPYLVARTPFMRECKSFSDADQFPVTEILTNEFRFAAVRQGSKAVAASLTDPLAAYFRNFSSQEPQRLLTALDGLCATVAFIDRNREQQPSSR